MFTLEEFREVCNSLAEKIPPRLLEELNGGIVILEDVKRDPQHPPSTYVLGEYIVESPGIGRLIVLYYGSFKRLYAGRTPGEIREEIWKTLKHELRHHLEDLAGVDDLAREDLKYLESLKITNY